MRQLFYFRSQLFLAFCSIFILFVASIISCTNEATLDLPKESLTTLNDGSLLRISHVEEIQFYSKIHEIWPIQNDKSTILSFGTFGRIIGKTEEVTGLILFFHEGHQLSTRLYCKDEGTFKEIPEYNLKVQGISLLQIKAISSGFKNLFPGVQFVNLSVKKSGIPALENYPDELGIKILVNSYRKDNLSIRTDFLKASLDRLYTSAPPCEELPCETGPGTDCEVYTENTYQCLDACSSITSGGILLNSAVINQSQYDDLFINSSYYLLRDSIGPLYDIADKFVNYYFGLSEFLESTSGAYSIELLTDLLGNMSDIKAISQTLTDSSQSNTVPLDSVRAENLLNLLNSYRGLSDNEDYIYILDDIKSEIETYKNMTVAQIYAAQ